MTDTATTSTERRQGTGWRLGVDVGGTFTDLLLLDRQSGRTHTAKVPSTPKDSSIGVLNGIEKICRAAGIDPHDIAEVMHGTTVATNTVLTLSGALVGLVTTKGCRDSGMPRSAADFQDSLPRQLNAIKVLI